MCMHASFMQICCATSGWKTSDQIKLNLGHLKQSELESLPLIIDLHGIQDSQLGPMWEFWAGSADSILNKS